MVVDFYRIQIPYQSVVGDLATRDGVPGRNNYPFEGMLSSLLRKGKSSIQAVFMERLANCKRDYDFLHKRVGMPYDYNYATIEEVPYEDIARFVEQTLYSVTNYNKGGVVQYRYFNAGEQRVLKDNETGDISYESETLTDETDYTYEELMSWRRKVPYLVKRLYDKSIQCGFHVLSAMVAKIRCISDNKPIMPKTLIENGIYIMTPDGNPGARVLENVGAFQSYFSRWLRGEETLRDPYYDDMQELYYICERLGLSLYHEEPVKFNKEFVDNLVCDYIAKNHKVILNAAMTESRIPLTPSLRSMISNLSLDDLDNLPTILYEAQSQDDRPSLVRCVEHVTNLYLNSSLYVTQSGSFIPKSMFTEMCQYYYMCFKRFIDVDRLVHINEFLAENYKEHLILPVAPFVGKNIGLGIDALIHRSGTLILLDKTRLNRVIAYIEMDAFITMLKRYHMARMNKTLPPEFKWRELDVL